MNITFYQFAKRTNSTKQVNVAGMQMNCQLKAQTDMISPVLEINGVPNNWNPIYNYCYIPGFKRYYFINNWRWLNGIWQCECVVDVLASFKTEIGNMTEYISRSSYEFDEYIPDTAYVTTADVRCKRTLLNTRYLPAWNAGFYVIGIISCEDTATLGAITYYQMSSAEFGRLKSYLLDDDFLREQGLMNLADFIPPEATKVIYNPFQYIVSCKWFPFLPSAIPDRYKTYVDYIKFGWWTTQTAFHGNMIHSDCPLYEFTEAYPITNHPQISRGVWLNRYPYTQRILKLAPFGDIVITDDQIKTGSEIKTKMIVDFISGVAILEVTVETVVGSASEVTLIARESQDLSVDIQLAQVGRDYYGAMATQVKNLTYEVNQAKQTGENISSGAASGTGGLLAGSFVAGIEMGQLESYHTYVTKGDYLKASAPQLLTSGTNGSLSAYATRNYLYEFYYLIEEDDNIHIGRPLSDFRQISNIPGFILIEHPDISLNCFDAERRMIAQFMKSGFYFE